MNKRVISVALIVPFCAISGARGQSLSPDRQSTSKDMTPMFRGGPEATALKVAEERERFTKIAHLDAAAAAALDAGQYAEAEADARGAVSLDGGSGKSQEFLATALNAQGKTLEALQAYKTMSDESDVLPRNQLPYALLLLKTGQWAQAAAAYNTALPYIAGGDLLRARGPFSLTDPRPADLATAIHIGLGLTYLGVSSWGGRLQNDKALSHFQRALAVEANSPLANYYYGHGLRRLRRQTEAVAYFQKAAALDGGDIKRAAEEQMKGR